MVDRADPLSHPGPPRTAGPSPSTALTGPRLRITLAAIAVLELIWLGWFLVVPLPNAPKVPNVEFRRGFLLLETFPQVVPGTTFRRSMLGNLLSELSHVENLPQRVPILLAAGLIAAAAIGLGDAILGLLKVRDRLRWPERIAMCYGLGAALLGGLTLIVGRMGWLEPWFIRTGLAALAALPLIRLGRHRWKWAEAQPPPIPAPEPRPADPLAWLFVGLMAPFVVITMLGAMLPATDFDVLEYHLQGPKEYFQAGRIQFLPHNVYTNMPFDVEMLHLLGMSVMGEWWWGGLVGQLLVALFGPAAAVLIFATAARVSTRAGWLAALVYLSTPWVYRFGIIAYVEGPLCFYHIALVWAWLEWVTLSRGSGSGDGAPSYGERPALRPSSVGAGSVRRFSRISAGSAGAGRNWLLLGLLAGAAMGCKYTALISAAIPFGVLAIADAWRLRSVRPVFAYILGWAVVMAPWLVKNVIDTGDPVYPLGYRFFHGRNWDPAMEIKWRAAHGPRPFSWEALAGSIVDIAGRSDWQSPLYMALAPLALLVSGSRRLARVLGIYALYLFATWFFLTHRLDRFWLPLLPLLAVLAGVGADWTRHLAWQILLGTLLAISLLCNLVYDSSIMAGFNEWTGDLYALRHGLPERLNRPLALLDARLSPDDRVLLVGQAAVFHFEHPMVYNTVFNDETIEELARGRDLAGLRKAMRDRGLTHVFVDWKEVQRHKQPGGYGFTDFVTRERFASWVAAGLLDRPIALGTEQELYRIR